MGEVLLVTGSSGIAAATARMWPEGNPVFILGSDAAGCRALRQELAEADFCVADVRDESAVRRAVQACLARFGRIDAVFNVAGISARARGDGPLHECTSEGWDEAMDVNAKGTFQVCREVLRGWVERQQKGAILNMGSV
ncbi:MAG: SDR family NAD(P)-dependent oxidoreductase, partial [Acidobacteriota bacterium]